MTAAAATAPAAPFIGCNGVVGQHGCMLPAAVAGRGCYLLATDRRFQHVGRCRFGSFEKNGHFSRVR